MSCNKLTKSCRVQTFNVADLIFELNLEFIGFYSFIVAGLILSITSCIENFQVFKALFSRFNIIINKLHIEFTGFKALMWPVQF